MRVSFDVFDTAIVREVFKPTDLFDYLGDASFKEKRIEAENKARQKDRYYNIYDIYTYLPEYTVDDEIRMEISNCRVNPQIKNQIIEHILNEDDILFISDMYLPSSVIKQMLIKCGYRNPKVYVSCEMKACKGDGRLYYEVTQKAGKIDLHYGDNYHCDCVAPRWNNIETRYVKKLEDAGTPIPELTSSKLRKLLALNEKSNKHINNKVAFQLSTMLYDFTKWILDSRKAGQKIFFNARDGYLPYIIARDIFKAPDIYYIRCSRKSVLPCSIDFDKPIDHPVNSVHFQRLILSRTGGVKSFLGSLNYPVHTGEVFPDMSIRDYVLSHQGKLYEFFKQNKKCAEKYLAKFDIQENDMLVDVGYFGSIQFAIESIIKKPLKGYYLQTFESELPIERFSYFTRKIVKYCLLIESIMSSSEDGVYGYTKDGEPLFYADNKQKKEFSDTITKEIMSAVSLIHMDFKDEICREDIEKIVIRFLYYPTLEEAHYCNEPIFENGNITQFESCVWYDRDRIIKGELQDCYDKSYWRPAFITLLRNDKELAHLEKLIRVHYD